MKRKTVPPKEFQLSLFSEEEIPEETRPKNKEPEKDPNVIDFIRARYEHGPEMTQEEYKRWIRILVNSSIKRLE